MVVDNHHVPVLYELATVASLNILCCRPVLIDSVGYFLSKSSVTVDRWSTTLESSKGGWTAMNIAMKVPTGGTIIDVRLLKARYAQPKAKSLLNHDVVSWPYQR